MLHTRRIKRKCACGCGRKFRRRVAHQIYATARCRNRESQRRLRERASSYPERLAEAHGSLGLEAVHG